MESDEQSSHLARRVGGVVAAVSGVAATVGSMVVGRLLRHAGAHDEEVEATLPGDELLPDADVVSTRAIAIGAPVGEVWPWLVQIGYGRAGWYSLDALERLAGAARSVDAEGNVSWRSLDTVVERHQELGVGDVVPLNDRVGLTVEAIEPEDHVVLLLDERVAGVRLRWVWTLWLRETGESATRLVARTRSKVEPRLAGTVLQHLVLEPGHAVMELVQLRGIRSRAQHRAEIEASATPTPPVDDAGDPDDVGTATDAGPDEVEAGAPGA